MKIEKILIGNLIIIINLIVSFYAFGNGMGNMFLNLIVTGGSGLDNHGFETSSFAWAIANDGNKGCTNLYQASNYSHTGKYSLQLKYNLKYYSPNRQGSIELDLTKTNIAGQAITVYIYCPTNSGGTISAPNGIVLYTKDINWNWHQSSWSNIGPSQTGFWRPFSWTLPVSNWASNIRIFRIAIFCFWGLCNKL